MICPNCKSEFLKTIDSRQDNITRRRKKCIVCLAKFSTIESFLPGTLKIPKKVENPFNLKLRKV